MRRLFVLLALALLVVACKAGEKSVSLTAPFIGGTEGIAVSFQDFRAEVFDGGADPFDVIVKLENKGEALVAKDKIQVKLSGINPAEFDKAPAGMILFAPDDSIENRLTEAGVIPSPPVFVEFVGLNHKNSIAGGSAQFTLRADVCYSYKTRVVSKLCVRENLLTPRAGGICELNEAKPVYNSGAPVQVAGLEEVPRAKDKIGFSFEIKNVGAGNVFERNKVCDRSDRKNENKVYVTIQTGLAGLSCTGLESTSNGAEGFVTLYGGSKIVSCSQSIASRSDYEQLIGVELVYDYEQTIQNTLTVKSSGE